MRSLKLKLITVALLLLQGCAITRISANEYGAFIAKDETTRKRGDVAIPIEVISVEDALLFCNTELKIAHSLACSRISNRPQQCTIVISKHAPAVVVGHEFRHCFEGGFH